MKISIIILLALVKVSFLSAGDRKDRIIGGHEAAPNSHPYLVSLQMRFLWARFRLCSGSLLSRRWILTAGHCVKGSWLMNWLPMEAIVGAHDIENMEAGAQRVLISERIPHPLYSGGLGAYDIAMLRTASDVTYTDKVYPIDLPSANSLKDHDTLVLAGWGVLRTTVFIPDLPDKLHEADVHYIPYDECYTAVDNVKESYEGNPLDEESNICTGPLTGGVAACSGDSGGPLIQYVPYTTESVQDTTTDINLELDITTDDVGPNENKNNENAIDDDRLVRDESTVEGIFDEYDKGKQSFPVIIGVVSWGVTPCGEVGAPTVYTNVSRFIDFINIHLYN